MARILGAVIGLVVLAAVAASLWYFRPWSEYSPAQIAALDDPENYDQIFQRMDELLPHRPIAAPQPEPFPEGRPAVLPDELSHDGARFTLDAYLEAAEVTSLLILHEGEIVHEQYRLGAGPDTRHTSWSVAKSVVATLIAMGLADGAIESLDDPAERYAPQFAGTDYGATSLRHLLMMSAGMDFNEDYEGPDSDIRPFFLNAFVFRRNVDEMAAAIARDRTPGEDLHYVSPNSHVLAAAARGALGGNLPELVEQRLWGPLNMTAPASWLVNKPGEEAVAVGYCCLQATTRDYARFGQLYAQDGVWKGERLLPEGWVTQASQPNAPFQEPGPDAPYAPEGYGLHFWVPPDADGEFTAQGVYGQYIWIDRTRDVVIVQTAGDPGWGGRREQAFAVFRALAEAASAPTRFAEAAP
jgi:hypothetical protein